MRVEEHFDEEEKKTEAKAIQLIRRAESATLIMHIILAAPVLENVRPSSKLVQSASPSLACRMSEAAIARPLRMLAPPKSAGSWKPAWDAETSML